MSYNFRQNKKYPNHRLGVQKIHLQHVVLKLSKNNAQKWGLKMGILGNMQLPSSFSRILTSNTIRMGTVREEGSQRYYYRMFAVHKLPFVASKFRLRRVQKNGKKSKKKLLNFLLFFSLIIKSFFNLLKTIWKYVFESKFFDYFSLSILMALILRKN